MNKNIVIAEDLSRYFRDKVVATAQVLVSRSLFYEILEKIKRLKPIPIGYD